jgi:hypothetical protein
MNGQRGEMSLTGLLVAMTLTLAVMTATLDIFDSSQKVGRDVVARAEAQDRVRLVEERLARELRNLAGPNPEQPQAIDRAGQRDLVFKTVNPVRAATGTNTPNVQRVRYCLDGSGRLWRMEQRWTTATTPPVPGGTTGYADDPTCSSSGWDADTVTVAASSIVNAAGGTLRPVFTYDSTTDTSSIATVAVDLRVDLDAQREPAESRLTTSIFLRNQNRRPEAGFTYEPSPSGLVLNASASSDPEGHSLNYCWYDEQAPMVSSPPAPCAAGRYIGNSFTFTYNVAWRTSHNIWLEVRDPALLSSRTATESINNGT